MSRFLKASVAAFSLAVCSVVSVELVDATRVVKKQVEDLRCVGGRGG